MNFQKVLIVENDFWRRQLYALVLRDLGVVVEEAESELDALKSLKKCVYRLAVIEIATPDVAGLSLFRNLQVNYPLTKIIVCSEKPREIQKSIIPCADGYYCKENRISELLTQVKYLCFYNRQDNYEQRNKMSRM